jgi:hypothetical protein
MPIFPGPPATCRCLQNRPDANRASRQSAAPRSARATPPAQAGGAVDPRTISRGRTLWLEVLVWFPGIDQVREERVFDVRNNQSEQFCVANAKISRGEPLSARDTVAVETLTFFATC